MSVRGDEETVAPNARWTALWTSLIVFVLSLVLWAKFDPARPASSSSRSSLAAGIRRRLPHGRRRHLGAVRAALHRPDADLHPGKLGIDHRSACAST